MRRCGVILVGLIALYVGRVEAEMISVKSMHDVELKIEQLLLHYKSKEILAAVDVDMTLTQPNHSATFYPNLKQHSDIYKRIMGNLTPEQRDLTNTLTVLQLPIKLVEKNTPAIIKSIQEKGVESIAFTAILTRLPAGCTKTNDRIEEIRFNALSNLGINFENSFKRSEIIFYDMLTYHNHYPTFSRGILYANGENGKEGKGAVLVAFIKKMAISPKVSVLVDDRKKNIENVEQYLNTHYPNIQFVGIEYQGAFTYAPEDISAKEFEKFWQNRTNEAKAALLAIE
jgi:hypothetical protein